MVRKTTFSLHETTVESYIIFRLILFFIICVLFAEIYIIHHSFIPNKELFKLRHGASIRRNVGWLVGRSVCGNFGVWKFLCMKVSSGMAGMELL